MFLIFSVFYTLIAVAMIVLILMQRGAGADAGSGFGGGASATVFGARGSANFMSRATAVLAVLFFLLSLGMGFYLKMHGAAQKDHRADLGVMAGLGRQVPTRRLHLQVEPSPSQVKAPVRTQGAGGRAPTPGGLGGDVPAAPAPVAGPGGRQLPVVPKESGRHPGTGAGKH